MNTTSDGTPIPVWKASRNCSAAADRKIFTWKNNGSGWHPFTYGNLSNAKQTAIGSADVVDFIVASPASRWPAAAPSATEPPCWATSPAPRRCT